MVEIKSIISQTPAMDVNLEMAADRVITYFWEALCDDTRKTPGKICYEVKDAIDKIAKIWRKDKQYIIGRQPESFLLNYASGNRYLEVVNIYAGTDIKYKNTELIDFDKKTFAKMVSIQTAFHLAKFGTVILYEIQLAALLILLKYFRVFGNAVDSFDDKVWSVSYEDVKSVFELIPYINEYDKANFDKYVIKKKEKKIDKSMRKAKPEVPDDYLKFYQDGMNVDQWIEELKYQWGQSRSTIFCFFKKFNIRPKEITKKINNC